MPDGPGDAEEQELEKLQRDIDEAKKEADEALGREGPSPGGPVGDEPPTSP